MSVHYECDRCCDVDPLHTRAVNVEMIDMKFVTMGSEAEYQLHLCGHCHSLFVDFMAV